MRTILLLFFLSVSSAVFSQKSIGFEVQAYPAGVVPGLRFDILITSNSVFTSRAGYNFTDRRDWGKHDNEEGGGPGFSIGLIRKDVFTDDLNLHIRSDLWFMNIDWEELRYIGCPEGFNCTQTLDAIPTLVTGTTNVTIFQPTIGLDYNFELNPNVLLRPSVSFGYEINVKTEGEDVGEGAILLLGLNLAYQF